MKTNQIASYRLNAQQLVRPSFTKAGEVVEWLGAVQAQDFLGSLWSVGQRLKKAVEADVEEAIANKTMVRTWPMRGTLHFVAPKDVRWMLKHLTPRVFARMAGILRKDGIDDKVISKSRKLWIKALAGGKQLTRDELYGELERGKISTAGTRGLHILTCVAQEGMICFGPRRGKQHTLVLLDEWLPSYPVITKDEALGELAIRYFTSHGPATAGDFMWWAGLTKADAMKGIFSAGHALTEEVINKKSYLLSPDAEPSGRVRGVAYLLPTYDEFGIAYKDRSAIIDREDYKKVGGFYTSGIMIDGRAVGVWRRTLNKDTVLIETRAFNAFDKEQRNSIEAAAIRYAGFIGKKPAIHYE
jgi:hypothetical protein